MSANKRHTVSSFAAPTPRDLAAFERLTPEEKRELLAAEIEKGLEGTPRKVSAEEILGRGSRALGRCLITGCRQRR